MTIGINWKEIWDESVWDAVWRQTAVVAADEGPPRGSRVKRSRLTRKAPAKPRTERKKRVAKLLPPVEIRELERVVIPSAPAIAEYARKLTPIPAVECEIVATLEGVRGAFRTRIENRGHLSGTLEGVGMEMTVKAQVYDDAVSVYMGMPELEPELVDA